MSVFKVGSNKSSQNNFPSVRPTLDLDFANTKALDPRITFTRASGGSYYGADGLIKYAGVNEPRFDHDPYTGESLGFLVEEARTNLITYSEQFDNAGWTAIGTVTANATIAPDGTATADGIVPIGGLFFISQVFTAVPGTYTSSVFVKDNGAGACFVAMGSNTEGYLINVNTVTGALISERSYGGGSLLGYSIISVGNGWFRISVSATAGAGGILVVRADGTFPTLGIYIWGAQLEAGAFPTSYIPTVASTRTRAADAASITGANFSSWYNPNAGTLFAAQRSDTIQDAYKTSTFILSGNNSNAHFIGMDVTNDYNRFYIYGSGATTTIENNYLPVTPGTLTKNVLAYANNNVAAARNGGTVFTDTSVGLPIVEINRATIGHNPDYGQQKRQHLSRLTYYPKRLPDAQLITLTR